MEKQVDNIGKIIEECINKPVIRDILIYEKNMTVKQREIKDNEFARAIGYCILFRSTEDIEQYMAIQDKEKQIEFLKDKIAKTLNIPKEKMQDKCYEMFEYAYKNFHQNGYLFHGTNSASAEKKMKEGLNGTINNNQHKEELLHIESIYKKYGNNNPLGWGILDIKNNKNGWFFDGHPRNTLHYANSPEWFRQFCGHNHAYMNIVPEEHRNGYENRDYETALETVTALIDKNKMTDEDRNEVLAFFKKCWAQLGNTKPCLLLIPLQELYKIPPADDIFDFIVNDKITDTPLNDILNNVLMGQVSPRANTCSKSIVSPDKLSCVDLTPILPRFKIERNQEERITLDSCIKMLKGFNLEDLKQAQQMLLSIEKEKDEKLMED